MSQKLRWKQLKYQVNWSTIRENKVTTTQSTKRSFKSESGKKLWVFLFNFESSNLTLQQQYGPRILSNPTSRNTVKLSKKLYNLCTKQAEVLFQRCWKRDRPIFLNYFEVFEVLYQTRGRVFESEFLNSLLIHADNTKENHNRIGVWYHDQKIESDKGSLSSFLY